MPHKKHLTKWQATTLTVAKMIDEREQATSDHDVDMSDDGWTEDGTMFYVIVCSARRGVPASMTMRVVANSPGLARVRVKALMEEFTEGTELLANASYTRSGESCRAYLDPTLLGALLACIDGGTAGPRLPRPARLSPLDMSIELMVRRGALEAERTATVSRVTSGLVKHPDPIDRADWDRGDRTTFNMEVCSMRTRVLSASTSVLLRQTTSGFACARSNSCVG